MFVMFLFNIGWFLGKFTEYRPRVNKYKYIITYNDGPHPTQLQLKDHYRSEDEQDEPSTVEQAGMWVLLKKTGRPAD